MKEVGEQVDDKGGKHQHEGGIVAGVILAALVQPYQCEKSCDQQRGDGEDLDDGDDDQHDGDKPHQLGLVDGFESCGGVGIGHRRFSFSYFWGRTP